jgi:hypothetical protein
VTVGVRLILDRSGEAGYARPRRTTNMSYSLIEGLRGQIVSNRLIC